MIHATRHLSLVLMLGMVLAVALPVTQAAGKNGQDKATATEQTEDRIHQLVIQVNSDSMEEQDHLLSNIVNLQKHYGLDGIEIEVVGYGPGVWLLTEKSHFANRVESLMLQNVVFTACGNTLSSIEAKEGTRPTLLEGVETTPAGIARIIELQEKGWSYLSP